MKDQSSISPPIQRFLRISIWIDIILLCVISTLDLIGWTFDIPFLRDFGFRWNTMKPVTAIIFLLCAIALLFLMRGKTVKYAKTIPGLCGLIMMIIGLLIIICHAGVFLTGKELSFTEIPLFKIILNPGWRMSIFTGINFLFLGIIFMLQTSQDRRRINLAHTILLFSALSGYMLLVSYILGIYHLGDNKPIQVALNTVINFNLVSAALFYLRPESWIMKIFTGYNNGSRMARKLLPGIFFLPLIIGWLRLYGEHAGLFSSDTGVAIVVVTYTLCFIWLVWLAAHSVNKNEMALRASQERFSTTLASIGDAVIATDIDGNITFLNRVGEELTGWKNEEAINKPVKDVFHIINEHTRLEVENPVTIVLKKGMIVGLANHTILVRKDGTEVPVDDSGAPIRGQGGEIEGVVLVFRDITERRKSETALRDSESTLRLAQQASNAGTWDWDIPAGTIRWTPELFIVFGFDPDKDSANFDLWNQVLHPDDKDVANERIGKALKEHKALDSTYRIIKPDGQIRWIRATGEGSYDEAGNAVRMLGICQDITQLWKMEESLRESEERYRSLFNTMIEGFCIIEVIFDADEKPVDYRFLEINPIFEAQTGLHDAQGKLMSELAPEQEHYWYETYGRIALTGVPEQFENEAKALGRWFEVSAYRVGQPEDRKVAILFNDITQRRLMENQIRSEALRALALSDLAKMFSESVFNLTIVFDTIARRVAEYIGDICIITQMSQDEEWLLPVAFYHPDPEAGELLRSLFPNVPIRNGEGSVGKAALTGQPVKVSGISKEQIKAMVKPEFWPYLDRFGVYDYLIVPLKTEGRVIGTIGVIRLDPGHSYTAEDQVFLEVIASRAAMAIKNSRLYEALQKSHDELEQKVKERTSELNQTMTVLSLEQKRFRDVLDMLPSFVTLMNRDYLFTFKNKEFIERFGDSTEKRCYEHLFSRNEPCENCHTDEVLSTSSCAFWEWQGPDGLTYDISEIPFTDVDGSKLVLKIGSDITNIKQAEADRIAREVAESANRSKSEFLANISHEIRTPMNSIIGFSDLLSSTIKDEKQLSQIKAIQVSSKNLLTLINDILDLSKIEAGKMKIQPEPVNFHKLISEIENVIIHRAQEKGIGFFIETEKDVPGTLLIDETRLRQVLFNLLENAVKFTDQGHVILTIDRLLKKDEKIDLVISIEDTGIGIPEDQQEMIFQAFSRQKGLPEKKYSGTGLGLTITRRLVELMGGSVNLTSKPGKGSIFTVILPDIPIVHETGKVQREKIFDIRTIRFKKSRILIADDNFENRKLLIDLLGSSPLDLIEAANGKEALELATKYLPDLILMDLRMPEMSGYEATRILKNQDSTKAIPIVALSASPKIVFNGQSSKDIFDDFIMKPVNLADLAEHLKKYLPHEVEEYNQQELSAKPVQNLTGKQKQHLKELIETLENEFLPVYRKALAKQVISQINLFGQNLIQLGEKSGSGLLMDYGKDICSNAENFDVEHLMEKLRLFPEIIDRLKKSNES